MTEDIEIIRVQTRLDGRMDTHNAGLFLGLSPKTLAMMRSAGTGPRFLKRGRVFYYRRDLEEWLAEQPRVRSTSEARARGQAEKAA